MEAGTDIQRGDGQVEEVAEKALDLEIRHKDSNLSYLPAVGTGIFRSFNFSGPWFPHLQNQE